MSCKKCGKEKCKHLRTEVVQGDIVRCLDCGKAGRKPEIYSRVCGYLRPVTSWNNGKRQEFEERVEYKLGDKDVAE